MIFFYGGMSKIITLIDWLNRIDGKAKDLIHKRKKIVCYAFNKHLLATLFKLVIKG